MGNRGRNALQGVHDFKVWEQFSYNRHVEPDGTVWHGRKATPDQIKIIKTVIVKVTLDQIQRTGAAGTKRKRALKRLRALAEENDNSTVIQMVQEAVRLGVPYDNLSGIATLLST